MKLLSNLIDKYLVPQSALKWAGYTPERKRDKKGRFVREDFSGIPTPHINEAAKLLRCVLLKADIDGSLTVRSQEQHIEAAINILQANIKRR